MDYRRSRTLASVLSWLLAALLFTWLTLYISAGFGVQGRSLIAATLFLAVFQGRRAVFLRADKILYRNILQTGYSKLMASFTERVRTCFTMPEFITAIREGLEKTLDASVMLIKSNTWEVVYASPATLTSDPGMLPALKKNFRELSDGIGFLDERYSLSGSGGSTRGFFILGKGYYFFMFSRGCSSIDQDAYRVLYAEILIFFDRVLTVSRLFQIATLSKEWRLIAETQRTFLPKQLPEHPKMSLAAYFRPLVNVSGDFYDAIKIDDDRTLLVMGDVSGKGLAAALIMGIAINTIRASSDKADLESLVRKCDSAIREMGFDDKYTVLFLGIADLKNHTLSYVNAAMPDQFLVVRTVRGPVIKRLESNNGIVGLVPLKEIAIEEVELRTDDVIILSSDGLTELESEDGMPLEASQEFTRLLGEANDIDAEELVERLATLGETFVGGAALKDDITILSAKVGRLWD